MCAKGNYLLSVKENQPALHREIIETFTEAEDPRVRSVDECARPAVEVFEETDKGHGRVEKRTLALCRELGWVTTADRWADLTCLVKVTRERTVLTTSRTSTETAYYIGNDTTINATSAAHRIRRHWSIENELHWVLDMAFREDEARHLAENMTTMRHFALNILRRNPHRRLGVAASRKRAGWDHAYLLSVLAADG